jgi:hypothetical protein
MSLKKLSMGGFIVLLVMVLCVLQPVQAPNTDDGEIFALVSPIFIDSPSNTTYAVNHVCLSFIVSTYVDCRTNNITLIYSLDGKDNVTIPIQATDSVITGVVNLEKLKSGSHSLTVFGIYSMHQSPKMVFDSRSVYFTIAPEMSGSEPRGIILYVVAVVILLVVAVLCVLLIKFKQSVKHGQ